MHQVNYIKYIENPKSTIDGFIGDAFRKIIIINKYIDYARIGDWHCRASDKWRTDDDCFARIHDKMGVREALGAVNEAV